MLLKDSTIFTSMQEALEQVENVRVLHLIKQKGIKKLLKNITRFEALEELRIQSCTMSVISDEIWKLSQLKSLTIIDCGHRMKTYPEGLGSLVNLEYLCLGKQSVDVLSETIGNLQKLKTLRLENIYIEALPDSIRGLENLTRVELVDTRLRTLPLCLKNLNLEHLQIDGMRLRGEVKPFPDDYFINLKGLKSLVLTGCDMTYSSLSIAELPNLEMLNLSNNSFLHFPVELLNLKKLGKQFYLNGNKHYAYGTPTNLSGANLVKQTVEKYNLSLEEAKCYYGCLGRYKVDAMNAETLLSALTQEGLPDRIAINAVDYIDALYASSGDKLQRGNCLAILGDYKLSRKEQKLCKEQGITLLAKVEEAIPEDCTHLLVGANVPKNNLKNDHCQLMAPKNFTDWIQSVQDLYLLEQESEEMAENVMDLLDSADTPSIQIALSLMQGGGVPQEAIPLLFIMGKMDSDASVKRKAKKLVWPLLSNKAKENYKVRGSFKRGNDIPGLVAKLLNGVEREIDKYPIYKYYYTRFSPQRYMEPYLLNAPKADQRKVVWDRVIQGAVLTLWDSWAFVGGTCPADEDVEELQHIEEVVFKGRNVRTIGRSFFKQLKNIRCIRLIRTDLSFGFSFDAQRDLTVFENLRCLEVSLNSSFRYLKNLFCLTSLEELHLSEMTLYGHTNELNSLPKEILGLQRLKVLRINHRNSNFQNLEVLANLPQLEHLSLASSPVKAIPLSWTKLTKLKLLDLRGTGIEVLPKEVADALGDCKVIF